MDAVHRDAGIIFTPCSREVCNVIVTDKPLGSSELSFSDNRYFKDIFVIQHTVMTGYRRSINRNIGLIINGIYRYDENMGGIAKGQLKSVFLNTFRVGAGYRDGIAYTFNRGVRFKQFKIGYRYELSANKVTIITVEVTKLAFRVIWLPYFQAENFQFGKKGTPDG